MNQRPRIIRALWLAGNAAALASVVLTPPMTVTIVRVIADALLAVAWVMAIGRACRARRWGWACLMAVLPFSVWLYVFSHDKPQPAPPQATVPVEKQPTQPLPSWRLPTIPQPPASVREEPRAVREAREAIEDAERRYPEW